MLSRSASPTLLNTYLSKALRNFASQNVLCNPTTNKHECFPSVDGSLKQMPSSSIAQNIAQRLHKLNLIQSIGDQRKHVRAISATQTSRFPISPNDKSKQPESNQQGKLSLMALASIFGFGLTIWYEIKFARTEFTHAL